MATPLSERTIRRHPCLCAAIVLVFLVTTAAIALRLWDGYHLHQATVCLGQGRTRAGRRHLDVCLGIAPQRVGVQLMAARAARQAGNSYEAEDHLLAAIRLQPHGSPELTREWALHRAALGELGLVESFLLPKIHDATEEGLLACEALAEGYGRNYRGPEALRVLDVWQERQPDNLRLWSLRGDVWRQAESLARAVPCYRRVLELDPDNDTARRWLALCLLDGGQPSEALPHWQQLHTSHPDDADARVHLARCLHYLGESEQARHLLDDALAEHPDDVLALRTLGEIHLQQGRLTDAEAALRRALRAAPRDYKINGLLGQVLEQQGRTAEAESQREQTRQLEERWKQFRRLAREIAEHPHDAAYLCALGECLLELGFDDLGRRWLQNALREDPGCGRARERLDRRDREQAGTP